MPTDSQIRGRIFRALHGRGWQTRTELRTRVSYTVGAADFDRAVDQMLDAGEVLAEGYTPHHGPHSATRYGLTVEVGADGPDGPDEPAGPVQGVRTIAVTLDRREAYAAVQEALNERGGLWGHHLVLSLSGRFPGHAVGALVEVIDAAAELGLIERLPSGRWGVSS